MGQRAGHSSGDLCSCTGGSGGGSCGGGSHGGRRLLGGLFKKLI